MICHREEKLAREKKKIYVCEKCFPTGKRASCQRALLMHVRPHCLVISACILLFRSFLSRQKIPTKT